MITLDVKFPQSNAKITSAYNTYTLYKTYYNLNTQQETITDDILAEINSKGKYTSRARSDENGSVYGSYEVTDGYFADMFSIQLALRRKEIYKDYYVFSGGGYFNPQEYFQKFIKSSKRATDLSILKRTYVDGNFQYEQIPIAQNVEQLENYIRQGRLIIAKDFNQRTVDKERDDFEFLVDLYISPNIGDFPEIVINSIYEGFTYHLESCSEQNVQIFGENLNVVGVYFSGDSYSYPNSINAYVGVEGKEYILDSNTVLLKDVNNYISFKFNKWNMPNSTIAFSLFTDEIKIDRNNLIGAECNLSYRADKQLPSFGIISNTGKLEFNDTDGRVGLFAENNLLKDNVKVEMFLKNTLTKTEEQICELYTDVWNYDNDNRQVSVTLKDGLEELQDITPTLKIQYDPRTSKPTKASAFYINLTSFTPQKYRFKSFVDLDDKTKNILTTTIIQYPFMEQSTLWQMWTKLCEVCGLYIYKNNLGETDCSYAYGG